MAPGAGLPADVYNLGDVRLATNDEGSGAIDAGRAIEAARDVGYGRADPDTYLVVMGGRLVWLVRWTGVGMQMPGPSAGIESAYDHLYVTVDARSGSVVDATYLE